MVKTWRDHCVIYKHYKMDVKIVGWIIAVYSVMMDVSYAGQYRTIEVTDDECDHSYILNQNDHLVLSYMPRRPFSDDGHTFKHCIFTVINNSTSLPICIRTHGKTTNSYMTQDMCDRLFNYFIGYEQLPSIRTRNGRSCHHFERNPMCTSRSTVYAVFENAPAFAIYPVSVEIYVEEKFVTTTRRVTTTTYWYNNDDYDDQTEAFEFGDVMLKIAIGLGVVLTMFIVCCSCVKSQASENTGNQQDACSPNMPTYSPDMRSPGMPTYTESAPPYSEVMLHERQNEDKNWQIHQPVCQTQTERSNAANAFPIPENQPLCQDQPVTRYIAEDQAGNQTTPTAPPPDYSDLPPPPPYPGY